MTPEQIYIKEQVEKLLESFDPHSPYSADNTVSGLIDLLETATNLTLQ